MGSGVALGGAIGPLLGGVFTQSVTVSASACLVLTIVAMGVLGYCSRERSLVDSNHLLPPLETRYRILQIEIKESRFPGSVHESTRHDIHSRPYFQWRFFIRLVISIGHSIACPRRRLFDHIHYH